MSQQVPTERDMPPVPDRVPPRPVTYDQRGRP
jgi:hypothetical protein